MFLSAVNEYLTTEKCKFASNTFVKYVYSVRVHLKLLFNKALCHIGQQYRHCCVFPSCLSDLFVHH
jgi:hypothetical protein